MTGPQRWSHLRVCSWRRIPVHGRQQLAHQLQQSSVERTAAVVALHAGPDRRRRGHPGLAGEQCGCHRSAGATSRAADVMSFYEHKNFRLVAGTRGTSSMDGPMTCMRSYYYVTTFQRDQLSRSTPKSQRPAGHDRSTASRYASAAVSAYRTIFSRGRSNRAQLAYLANAGTAYGNNTEKIVHVDVPVTSANTDCNRHWRKMGWRSTSAASTEKIP